MKTFWTLLVFLPTFTSAVQNINNTEIYKPCISDVTECPNDQVCIQYFCYPKVASDNDPLKSCNKNSQCDGWRPSKTEKCFKEGQNGVCVPAEDYEMCESHEECKGRGEKCCGDYCCNSEYFDALISEIVCDSNDDSCLVIISKNNQYCKDASSNTSRLEAHAGFFRFLMKGIFDLSMPFCTLTF